MNKETGLTLGSLFDGSGGFPLAGILAGVTPLWASEIEPFAVRVTTKRLPQMKHYGDVSQMRGADLPPVDIITFGSPCQDMSIAGRRDGLDGSRSSLFYEAIRIVKEMREKTNGEKPRFIVWENVPGAFSSNKGQDFKAVLEAVIGIKEPAAQVPAPEKRGWPNADYYVGDGWSVAYRVLDAQWWGVPQRRARIFLVADFAGQSAPEILFESEGVSGYTPQGFRSWQGAAGDSSEGSGETGGGGSDGCLGNVAGEVSPGAKGIVLNDQGGTRMDVTEEVTSTLRAEAHHPPVVLDEPKAYHINQRDEGIDLNGVSGALMATRNNQMQTFIVEKEPQAAGFCTEHSAKSRSIGYEEEKSPTLRAGIVPAAVAVFENHSQDTRYTGPLDIAPTVNATYGMGGNNQPFVVEIPGKPELAAVARDVIPLEHHPTDSRIGIEEGNAIQTLTSRMGTGGNNVPLIMTPAGPLTPKTLKIRSGCEGGGKGALIQDDKSATLGTSNDQTVFVPFVKGTRPHSAEEAPERKTGEVANTLNTFNLGEGRCNELAVKAYGICSKASHSMMSDNPHSGFYEADTARTLDANGGNPNCNQGGIAVVAFTQNQRDEVRDLHDVSGALAAEPGMKQQTYVLQGSMIGRTEKNGPQGDGVNEDVSFTLNTVDHHAVAAPAMEDETYCATTGNFMTVAKEKSPTLAARDYKDPPIVNDTDEPYYIVRRLTPVECARLQGFPDWWCSDLGTDAPTEEDIRFWSEVWETHRKVMETSQKPKSEKQVIKWLKDPYSDSAEYKLWGNGVCLPIVFFVLSGIVWAASKE